MMLQLLADTTSTYWLPKQASTVAPTSDAIFYAVYWITVFFTVLITVLVVAFTLKYRHRKGESVKESSAGHSTTLELTWTIIPTIIVLILYYYGFRGFMRMTVEPPNPYEIVATGRMWNWSFTYPNGHVDPDLHVPADVPVRVVLRSEDVIHSLFIPDFRTKKDVVPGRYNRLWFQPKKLNGDDKPEEHDIFCAAYCGTNHSIMLAKAFVHTPADFDKWMEEASDLRNNKRTSVEIGEIIYKTRGCAQCHSVDGSKIVGPTWKDMYGSTVPTDKGPILADDAYVIESIEKPLAKIHTGFPPAMPAFQLKDYEMAGLISYMKDLSANYKGDKAAFHLPVPKPEKKP